ncbi:MAG TPA: alanine racemase [Alphaproteobacteria bacterium]|nr:alanine racemase [Alphaproteobacteria bacterium]
MPPSESAVAELTIDLAAVLGNWRKLREMVHPAECAAVVKADAYGLGADKVAPALAAAGCRLFYVARLSEGIALRKALPNGEIAVFDGVVEGSEASFAAHRLIPVLNSLEQIERWAAFARARGPQPAMLHLDSGMNRLGLPRQEVAILAADPDRLRGLALRAVISHLACADTADHELNAAQLARFASLRRGLPSAPASLAASSGIFLGKPYHLDQARPGAALYGVCPLSGAPNPMAQVVELNCKILQVRDVDSPQTVGYGATHLVRRPSRIATVGVGYADGYFRALGNRSRGFIGDYPAPLVGRVSMDLVTLDVTDVPAALLRPDARVELIGPHRTIDQVAADAGTIGYEVLTNLGTGRRLARRYLDIDRH